MKKGLIVFLLVSIIAITVTALSIIILHKFNVYQANLRADKIEIGDNIDLKNEIQDNNKQELIYCDDEIGKLTIPDILLEDAPIKESTELSTLNQAIGHFTSTSIYSGNVGLASHNGGSNGDFFKNLKDIEIGSEIFYQTKYGTKRYIVQTKKIIEETDFSYLQETVDNRITLITCVAGQKEKRLCVQAMEN